MRIGTRHEPLEHADRPDPFCIATVVAIISGASRSLNARDGDLLWRAVTGGNTLAAPITYVVNNQQYVAIASGHSLFVFGLRSP